MITPNGGVFGRNPKFNNVQVDGNLTVNGDIALGDDITVTDTLTVNGVTTVANTTESTTASNGALVVAGGVGIAKRLNVAGNIAAASGTASTTTTSGALVVTGGVGVSGAVNVGGLAFINNRYVGNGVGGVVSNTTCAGTADSSGWALKGTGGNNVAVGWACMSANHTTASESCGIGARALQTVSTGPENVAVGHAACQFTSTGYGMVGIGNLAANASTTVAYSVATTVPGTGGTDGGPYLVTLERASGTTMGTYPTVNVTVLGGAVSAVTMATYGDRLLLEGTGAIVFKANAAGVALGVPQDWRCQLTDIRRAQECTAVGSSALRFNSIGYHNTAVGAFAADAVVSGLRNTAVGFDALGLATGSDNTTLGSDAGDGIVAGNQNVCIGSNADVNASGNSNSIVIGYDATGDGSNTAVIGNASITSHKLHGTATSAVIVSGDTLRIVTRKAPASNAAGTAGDVCIGEAGGVHYLYYCIANNNWGRVAFTTGY